MAVHSIVADSITPQTGQMETLIAKWTQVDKSALIRPHSLQKRMHGSDSVGNEISRPTNTNCGGQEY
ncbi:hypothetical protein BTUL_0022g00110 [Botrytis tulipae]|uniref:Uncharacterized protein n=1 Tax=Botrytis tulipae TaxID=87230 RepID=A0A4Z1EZH9_9HELO|nr:hypothetical protein BTUL_0022g00110 [Botrytis tulipae]